MTGTLEKLSKAQFPTTKPVAASHLQLTHPSQPTLKWKQSTGTKVINTKQINRLLTYPVMILQVIFLAAIATADDNNTRKRVPNTKDGI